MRKNTEILTTRFKPLHFAYALMYAAILTAQPIMSFSDRASYVKYAQKSDDLIVGYLSHGILKLVSNEPLWLLFNSMLEIVFSPFEIIRIIIFTGAFMTSYLLLRASPKNALWIMLFLASPSILLKFTLHLRQGLAIGFFLWGYYSKDGFKKCLLMGATLLIHASFFYTIPFLIVNYFSRQLKLTVGLRAAVVLMVSIFLIASTNVVLSILSARQASVFSERDLHISGIGFIFWTTILLLLCQQNLEFLKKHQVAISITLFYLCTYFILPVSGRVFENSLPLVLVAGLSMRPWYRAFFIALFLTSSFYTLITRSGIFLGS